MSPSDAAAAQAALERELHALGIESGERPQNATPILVDFSDNLRGLVWVAEIQRGDARQVVIEERPKPDAGAAAAAIVIEKQLMLEAAERILDVAPLGRSLMALDRESVSIYESTANGWQRKLSVRIPVPHPLPRDCRGRLTVQGDTYQAYLPGLACSGNAASGLSISCRESSLWPVGAGPGMLGFAQFTPTRNFFDGRVLTPNGSEKTYPAFYSAAELQAQGVTSWVLAGVDGKTYFSSPAKESGAWQGWGSGIAGIRSECGTHSQVLATSPGDDGVPDSVRAYEMVEGTPRPAGAAAFPGPITEIWPTADRSAAVAISRDLKSGRYAAFRLAITCAH